MKEKFIALVLLLLFFQNVSAEDKPSIPEVDRIRIAEAFRLSKVVGDRVWQGWSKTCFAVLLITPDHEFLIGHPKPSQDFEPLGYDRLLKSDVYFRKRVYAQGLLATFPAVQGSSISTIVVGEAENTDAKTSTPWVVTLFHEHFHQLQNSQPTYFADVEALNLARGDKTGMWMLNYAFPYDKKEVQEQFSTLSKFLAEVVNSRNKADRVTKLTAYLQARQQLRQMLEPDDYKYLSFQFWQEGIARYTEYRVARLAAARYKPSKEFRALKDYMPFERIADETREKILKQLLTEKLGESKRVAVYPFGAAEGLLLDSVSPSWQSRYFVDKFDLNKFYDDSQVARITGNTGGVK